MGAAPTICVFEALRILLSGLELSLFLLLCHLYYSAAISAAEVPIRSLVYTKWF